MYYYQKINRTILFLKENSSSISHPIFKINSIHHFYMYFKLSLNKLNLFLPDDLIFYIYETIFNQYIYKDYYKINNPNSHINDRILYNYYKVENIELILLYNLKKLLLFDSFSFFSFNTIKKNYNLFEQFIDIGYIYIGLGHLISFSKMKNKNIFFFRKDGGSNGFDVIYNDNYMKTLDFNKIDTFKLLDCKQLVKLLCNYEIINNLYSYLV